MTTGDGAPGPAAGYDAVVLAGGAAARLGGADKPGLTVGGRSLLDRVVAACEGADRIVVVGPQRATAGVRWAREEPPGGGPVAAVAAGLAQVTADRVLLLAADLPFLDRRTLERLLAALDDPAPDNPALDDPALDDPAPGDPAPDGPAPDGPAGEHPRAEAALLVDAAGREQPLTAAYRTAALRRALAGLGDP
uniref:molybdenum cofactor guanylyltransferase n=1 Tax=Kitasatospora sp. MBT63 TaxID=1444768 RepID=UPI00055F84E1